MSDITSHPSTIGIRKCIKSQLRGNASHKTLRNKTKNFTIKIIQIRFHNSVLQRIERMLICNLGL